MENDEMRVTRLAKKKIEKDHKSLDEDFESHFATSMADLELVDCNVKLECEPEIGVDKLLLSNINKDTRGRTTSVSSDSSTNEMDDELNSSGIPNPSLNPFRSQEALNVKPVWQPVLIPFQDRRRLSQCKEEDEDDGDKFPISNGNKSKGTRIRHKFIVTKTENIPRLEAHNLKNLTAKQNAATIHFPCSSSTQHRSLMGLFSPQKEFNPHLDKQFFDTSLVEIRGHNKSSQSLHKTDDIIDANVWIPRSEYSINHVSSNVLV